VQTVCSSTAISSIQKIQIGYTARSLNDVLVEMYKLRKQVLLKCCYTFESSEVFNWYVYVLSLISTDHLANFDGGQRKKNQKTGIVSMKTMHVQSAKRF
jgi:hypothetical protein